MCMCINSSGDGDGGGGRGEDGGGAGGRSQGKFHLGQLSSSVIMGWDKGTFERLPVVIIYRNTFL